MFSRTFVEADAKCGNRVQRQAEAGSCLMAPFLQGAIVTPCSSRCSQASSTNRRMPSYPALAWRAGYSEAGALGERVLKTLTDAGAIR